MADAYNASKIKVLEGLEAVRMRPGMYIGSTGSRGLHHMLWEIVDNAIDEAMGGYCDHIQVTLHPDQSVTVVDNGRGVPVDRHPQLKISGVEVVYTRLHAGGKFGTDNYSYSGGLHGVGASVVNALSKWFVVDVHHDGNIYTQRFECVRQGNGRIIPGKAVTGLEITGKTYTHGTTVTFLPDPDVFETIIWNRETIERRLRELAFLNKGITITFTDEREADPTAEVMCYEGGIEDFVKYLNADKNVLFDQPILLEGGINTLFVSVAIQYTDAYTENIFSYVNNIPTTEGGMHETGFKTAVTKVMQEYARKNGLIKEKAPFTGEDFREGMTAVISLRMQNVQFEGQTKTKLGNPEARREVEALVTDQLTLWLDDLKNGTVASVIMDKAAKAAQVRAAAHKAKEIARKKNSLETSPLIGKLSACTGKDPTKNELFIVEGDSAGGSAKQGRDRRFQAILPLRGKPLNAEKKRLDAVLSNEEFRSIIVALGSGIAEDFDPSTLRYRKVIILSDADQDGAHIRAILLTFFFRYMRQLITEGCLFIGQPPLYRIRKGKRIEYAYDDAELQHYVEEFGPGYTIQRYKGLGEMDPEQLWETTMNPEGRKLIQVDIEDAADADRMITVLMGDKADVRREYIIRHANFNKHDSFDAIQLED